MIAGAAVAPRVVEQFVVALHLPCSWPLLRCRLSMTFCASPTAGALLPRANSSPARFTSSCFQPLIIASEVRPVSRRTQRVSTLAEVRLDIIGGNPVSARWPFIRSDAGLAAQLLAPALCRQSLRHL